MEGSSHAGVPDHARARAARGRGPRRRGDRGARVRRRLRCRGLPRRGARAGRRRLGRLVLDGGGRGALRARADGRAAVDAREPAGALRRPLRALGRRACRGAVLDPRIDLRERPARPRPRDPRRRASRRRGHALRSQAAQRHGDAASSRRLHHLAARILGPGGRPGEPAPGGDLGHRSRCAPRRLRRLALLLPQGRGGRQAGDSARPAQAFGRPARGRRRRGGVRLGLVRRAPSVRRSSRWGSRRSSPDS